MSCALIKCVAQAKPEAFDRAEPEAPAVLGGLTLEQVNKLKKENDDLVRAKERDEETAKWKQEIAAAKLGEAMAKKDAEAQVSFFLAMDKLLADVAVLQS